MMEDAFPDFLFDLEDYLLKDERLKRSDLDKLKSWAEDDDGENYVPKNISEKMLALVLVACGYDLEDAKKCLLVCYETRHKDPEMFLKRDLDIPETLQAFDVIELCLMPERTDDGYDIIIQRLKDDNPQNYHRDAACRAYLMTIDRLLYERGPSKGIIMVIDFTGSRFGHLFRSTISEAKSYMRYVQEGLPVKMKEVHVINTTGLFNRIMSIVKPFVKKEIFDIIHIYPCDHDMDDFHENVLPKKCLPKELDGNLASLSELHDENLEALRKMKQHFDQEEKNRKLCWYNNNNM